MEALLDNKTNLLNANIRSSVDNSIIYTITTSHNLWGRTVTILKDANPLPGDSPIVGAIYWRERLFEVHGHRKSISDIKHIPTRFSPTHPQDVEKVRGGRTERNMVNKKKKKKNERGSVRRLTQATQTTTHNSKTAKRHDDSNSVPHCPSSVGCWSLPRPSSALLGFIGLTEWWRSVTCGARSWRWSADGSEYELSYQNEQWKASLAVLDAVGDGKNGGIDRRASRRSDVDEKASRDDSSPRSSETDSFSYMASILDHNPEDKRVAASLYIPYRNHLFRKTKPPVLHLAPAALWKDEVFMILVLIYSEAKRQDRTNSSGGW